MNNLMAMPSAKGLFHKAINQSGSFRMNMLEKNETQMITEELLKKLEIGADEIEKLQTIPFDELAAAGKVALKKVEDQMKTEGKTIPGFGLSWGPSVDGDLLPYQMFSNEAFELSKDIPLLIGTAKNEFMMSLRMGIVNPTEEQAMEFIKSQYGEKADAYVAAVKKAYPNQAKPGDLLDIDMMFRPGAIHQANEKSKVKGGAPVYSYVFTWQSPIMDGKYKDMHCMELPFVFNNIDRCEEMTGGEKEAYELTEKMSKAWINFAKVGDPNHSGLPTWAPYTSENGSTILFDNNNKVVHHHDKQLMELMQ